MPTTTVTLADVATEGDLTHLLAIDLWALRSQASATVADPFAGMAERRHASRVLTWLRYELAQRALGELTERELEAVDALTRAAERLGVHRHLTGGAYDQLIDARRALAERRYPQAAGAVAEVRVILTAELAAIAAS